MTPRQLQAFHFFADKRRKIEHAEMIHLHALAARGEPKKVEKAIRDLTRD